MPLKLDLLVLVGLAGQFFYFLRFAVQWYYTERAHRVVVPSAFWVLSILGAVISFIYAYARRDPVFMLSGVLSLGMYVRSLKIALGEAKEGGDE